MPFKKIKKNTSSIKDDTYKFGFRTDIQPAFSSPVGLSRAVVEEISRHKQEPDWMREFRLKAYDIFCSKPMPSWGADLSGIDFDAIHYYVKPESRVQRRWEDVPQKIKDTFDKLGIPEAERKFLAGAGTQFDSEVVYHSLKETLQKKGVLFESMDEGLKKYPDKVKKYFGTIIPMTDNKFAALNSAVWSGGTFIYVPKGVHVDLPLQAYFRINTERMGQFERTLIIADEGSSVHYVEGCTAPTYSSNSLHSAVVEIIALPGSRVQYTTIQNWSSNVYNLVTKRATAHRNAEMFWLDCNLGSKVTMKYPCIILRGEGARGEVLSLAYAGRDQHQDAGAKVIHAAPHTQSRISSRSISKDGGRSTYRGLVRVLPQAHDVSVHVACEALLLDKDSRSDTYPTMDIQNSDVTIAHEATVSKIGDEELFYLRSRGLTEQEALSAIVNGFATPVIKQLPMEYAVELNRLLTHEMTGSIG